MILAILSWPVLIAILVRKINTPGNFQRVVNFCRKVLIMKKRLLCIILFLALFVTACGEAAAPTTSVTTPTVQATQAPATPAHALKWKTTQKFSGNGAKKTAIFTVPDDWKILWSCTGGDYGG